MKLTKNEAKKLAKNAKSIVSEGTYTSYDGDTSHTETSINYDAMIESLKETSRWYADQYDNKIFIGSAIHNFTISL